MNLFSLVPEIGYSKFKNNFSILLPLLDLLSVTVLKLVLHDLK